MTAHQFSGSYGMLAPYVLLLPALRIRLVLLAMVVVAGDVDRPVAIAVSISLGDGSEVVCVECHHDGVSGDLQRSPEAGRDLSASELRTGPGGAERDGCVCCYATRNIECRKYRSIL